MPPRSTSPIAPGQWAGRTRKGWAWKKPRCPESRAPPGTLLPQKAKDQPQDPVVAKPSVREC